MHRTLVGLIALAIIALTTAHSSLAEEECVWKKKAMMARSEEVIRQLIQYRSNHDIEGIKALIKDRRIYELPEKMPEEFVVDVRKKTSEGVVMIYNPMAATMIWTTTDDIECHQLADISGIDYFPLDVGYKWEYYKDDGKAYTYERTIAEKITMDNGGIEYRLSGGKTYVYQYKEGIIADSGIMLLKYPLKHKLRWISEGKNTGERFFYVKDAGFSITVKGKTYDNCIRIIISSPDHQLAYVEIQVVYAPKVGEVLSEIFTTNPNTKEKRRISSNELLSFTKDVPVSKSSVSSSESKPSQIVRRTDSFRYPQGGFVHPSLSPDEKWLLYFEDTTVWEKLYAAKLKNSDSKLVTMFSESTVVPIPEREKHETITVGIPSWSYDGKTVAINAEFDFRKRLALIDFSGDEPRFMEYIMTNGSFSEGHYWNKDGELIYLMEDKYIMKKKPGKPPENILVAEGIEEFRIASDGTILYRVGNRKPSFFVSSLKNPSVKTDVFQGQIQQLNDLSNTESVSLTGRFELSPNGGYAAFYLSSAESQPKIMMVLLDLKTLKINEKLFSSPIWSPDELKFAYISTPKNDGNSDPRGMKTPHFYIYDVKTGESRDYGLGFTRYECNWSPNGKYIIYSDRYTHDGGKQPGIAILSVADGKDIGFLSELSSDGSPDISPSGKYIIWQAENLDTFFVVKNPFFSQMF